MDTLEKEVRDVLYNIKDKPANVVTHTLANVFGSESSTMVDNMCTIVDKLIANKNYEVDKARKEGKIIGYIIGGASIGVITRIIWYFSDKRKSQLHDAECQAIVNQMKKELILSYEKDENNVNRSEKNVLSNQ